jgi:hypothetical protein
MPFTFAHPAAVLPLRRSKYLQTVPLIIGSLVPDVPYYFPARFGQLLAETHTLHGSFAVDVPLGMVLLIATLLLKDPLAVLLPGRARALFLHSVERFSVQPFRWPLSVLSLLIGSWTHIAWDSLTHADGRTVAHVHALGASISLLGWDTEVYHLLQYLSSILGLAVLAYWLRGLLLRAREPTDRELLGPRTRWLTLMLITITAVVVGGSHAFHHWDMGSSYYKLGFLLLTRTIAWFAALYLAVGLAVSFNKRVIPEPAN